MPTPDEVRVAMAATVLEATSLIRFASETHKEYALRKYEHVYQSAYASGSAARRERDDIPLNVIRNWPDGFQERLQRVWLDVVSFIPNVKLYDLQRTLAEFGFEMKVYEKD